MDDNARVTAQDRKDDDRRVELDDEIWEWARERSGLDDPTPFLMDILNKAMATSR